MTRALALIVTCVGLVGCGGGFDEDFNGVWVGPVIASGAGGAVTYEASMSISVDGDTMEVAGFCPVTGVGVLSLKGSGSEAHWQGVVTCPFPTSSCPSGTFSFATAELSVSNDTLHATGVGVLHQCGASGGLTMTFNGARR